MRSRSCEKWIAGVIFITLAFLITSFGSPAYAGENGSLVNTGEGLVYQKDGNTVTGFTGLVRKAASEWYYVKAGKVDFTKTGLVKNENGWWYVRRGKVDFGFTGFAENEKGTWYVKNGRVAMALTGIVKGKVKGETGWWYVKQGKVQFQTSTVAKNENGWWYIDKGKVDFNYTGTAKNQNGWWYVRKGKVDFKYTDFAENSNGWWYVKNGKINFKTSGVYQGTIKKQKNWYYVKNSKVSTDDKGAPKNIGEWFDIEGDSKLKSPLEPGTYDIYSGYGYRGAGYAHGASTFHQGMDFITDPGTKVLAAADGVVTFAGYSYNSGYAVIIDHGKGLKTLYCHGDRTSIVVKVGDKVKSGQVISHVGDIYKYGSSNYIGWYDRSRDTGTSSISHLHFTVYLNGRTVDPAPYLGLKPGARFCKYVVKKAKG